ncbi:MAG: drug/metabolite transporter (DMT)-like permease [Gammaproteobacteria bacterium]|jgi:drug/metabolite transporter (DMT)-like permease
MAPHLFRQAPTNGADCTHMHLTFVNRLLQRWTHLPGNVRGALWMLLGGVGFTGMSVCIKLAGQTLPIFEIVVLRAVFSLIVISPAIIHARPGFFRTDRTGAHILRSCFGFVGFSTMVLAITHLDLALATTLSFTRTLFMIVLAVLFLGEIVRWRRTAATAVGFIGVVICMHPSAETFNTWTLVEITAALFSAGVTTMIKRLTTTEPPLRILVWAYVLMGAMAIPPAIPSWQAPTFEEYVYVAAMGMFSAWGQSCMVNGLRAGEATAVAPFEYSRLVFASLAGFVLFMEIPTQWTWWGASIIIASTLYIALREAKLRTRKPTSART